MKLTKTVAPLLRAMSLFVLGAYVPLAQAQHEHDQHDGDHTHNFAPAGVMGSHLHEKGKWMFSYRFMTMEMDGNRDGTDRISSEEVIMQDSTFGGSLRIVPTRMTMDMHMFGSMYGLNNTVTLMAMVNYLDKEMDHETYNGAGALLGEFTTKSSGIGDTKLAALIRLGDGLHATAGLSLPTGSIDETDDILSPMNTRPTIRLPYPMQLGSGTYDLIAGLTYSEQLDAWAWGGQWKSVVRVGENSEDYTFGDEHRIGWWISRLLNNNVSISTRIEYINRENIDGQDSEIAGPVQTADPDRQGLDRADLHVGLDWQQSGGGNSLGLEIGVPFYQDLKGPQLETDFLGSLAWRYTF